MPCLRSTGLEQTHTLQCVLISSKVAVAELICQKVLQLGGYGRFGAEQRAHIFRSQVREI